MLQGTVVHVCEMWIQPAASEHCSVIGFVWLRECLATRRPCG